jgi:hypothetical protein
MRRFRRTPATRRSPVPPRPALTAAPTIEANGITVLCHGLLAFPQEWEPAPLTFLSIGGPREAVKGLLAAALTGHELTLRGSPHHSEWKTNSTYNAYNAYGKDRHRTLSRRLPCGQVHGLLFPANALPTHTGSTFTLLLQGNDEAHAATRLLQAIDRRSELPLHPSWGPWLWQTALTANWLTPLAGFGPWIGWQVDDNDAELGQQLTEAITTRVLTLPTSTPIAESKVS